MEKVTLKLADFYSLETELLGILDQKENKVLVTGLLNEDFELVTKVKLTKLLDQVKEETIKTTEKRNELINKYGEAQEDGSMFISIFTNIQRDEKGDIVSREENPNYKEFNKEYQQVLQQEVELEFEPFTLKDLEGVRSNANYPIFYKLVKLDQ